jgi:lysylphosphatidylglycerol synthetase-like protein (DUF2156 family)
MKRRWFGDRAHVDEEKVNARAKARADMRELIESGDEKGYAEYVKRLKPDMTPAELQQLIAMFHSERRKHPSDSWNRS